MLAFAVLVAVSAGCTIDREGNADPDELEVPPDPPAHDGDAAVPPPPEPPPAPPTTDITCADWCEIDCDPGMSCRVAAEVGAWLDVVCLAGSTCAVECAVRSWCTLECDPGAECILGCAPGSKCELDGCVTGTVHCPDGSLVCNRACP